MEDIRKEAIQREITDKCVLIIRNNDIDLMAQLRDYIRLFKDKIINPLSFYSTIALEISNLLKCNPYNSSLVSNADETSVNGKIFFLSKVIQDNGCMEEYISDIVLNLASNDSNRAVLLIMRLLDDPKISELVYKTLIDNLVQISHNYKLIDKIVARPDFDYNLFSKLLLIIRELDKQSRQNNQDKFRNSNNIMNKKIDDLTHTLMQIALYHSNKDLDYNLETVIFFLKRDFTPHGERMVKELIKMVDFKQKIKLSVLIDKCISENLSKYIALFISCLTISDVLEINKINEFVALYSNINAFASEKKLIVRDILLQFIDTEGVYRLLPDCFLQLMIRLYWGCYQGDTTPIFPTSEKRKDYDIKIQEVLTKDSLVAQNNKFYELLLHKIITRYALHWNLIETIINGHNLDWNFVIDDISLGDWYTKYKETLKSSKKIIK